MLKIKLINMPFASISRPSIGLTQLKSLVDSNFAGQVTTDILYLNHDFAPYIGRNFYHRLADSMDHHTTGLGDWIFRQIAFPQTQDNTEAYFQRCYPLHTERFQMLRKHVEEKRAGLEDFFDKLISKYELDQSDIVGMSSTFAQNVASFAMARKLKERNPSQIIVMGGANCESTMGREIARQVADVDYVFSGSSLKSFPRFVQHVLAQEFEKCNSINGVFSKSNCGSKKGSLISLEKSAPVAEVGDDLDINTRIDLDYGPYLELLDKNFPGENISPALLIETSRGCWWGQRAHCTFCGLNGGSMIYRSMNPELAVEQFKELFKYSPRVSLVETVDNIMPKSYVQEVLPLLDTPPTTHIFYEVKADLSEEDVRVLSQSNVRLIQPGIEALNTSTLKLMRKGTSVFQNLNLLKLCIKYDVRPSWNLLVGFPGEGEEVYQKYIADLPQLTHLYPPSGAFPVRFDRFSPYFVKAEEYGLNLKPIDFYELTYPFEKESLGNLAYYFADQNFSANYFTEMVKWISQLRERVDAWLGLWDNEKYASQPHLYFKDGGQSTVIYDSRSGKTVEHEVGVVGKQVLELLNKPKGISTVAKELSHIPDFDADLQIRLLKERGLVFEEDRRFMNLVLSQEPAPMTVGKH